MVLVSNKQPATYIITNKKQGVLYTGVTSDLPKRIYEHRNHLCDGFSDKYNTTLLVYFELHETMLAAITREKQIKNWRREWKISLIEKSNNEWADLYDGLF